MWLDITIINLILFNNVVSKLYIKKDTQKTIIIRFDKEKNKWKTFILFTKVVYNGENVKNGAYEWWMLNMMMMVLMIENKHDNEGFDEEDDYVGGNNCNDIIDNFIYNVKWLQ